VPTVGRPVGPAGQEAANQGVPISTIAFGTPDGTVTIKGRPISVPADPKTMAAIAEITHGRFFTSASEKQLRSI
jgi:Ca-activated chloride channel family protein